MRTDELIDDLVDRATPVRRLRPPGVRIAAWLATACVFVALGILVFGARPDIGDRMREPQFVWTIGAGLAVAISASAAALVLAIPGAERSPMLRRSTLAVIVAWGLVLLGLTLRENQGFVLDSHWPACLLRAFVVGAMPAATLFAMIRRAAPLQPAWTGALAAVAAVSSGVIAVHVACPVNDPLHTLAGHFAPVVATGWLGALAGRRWLRMA